MNIISTTKHYLDMFFFPFLTCYGFEHNWKNIFCKSFILLIWTVFYSFLFVLIYELLKRKNENYEVGEQNKKKKTVIDLGVSFFLITTIFFMILLVVNCYIIYLFSGVNKATQISQVLFTLVFFIFFIYYCKFMNAYYNPSIEKVEEKNETTDEEKSKYIYNKDKNNGTLIFFWGLIIVVGIFYMILILPWFPVMNRSKKWKNFISDFFQLNISKESNTNFGGSYLSLLPVGGGCIITI